MADEGIQAFGTVFRTIKARDREVIIDDNGLINYTSLMESITGKRYAFRNVCSKNGGLYRHVLYHDREKLEAWAKEELASTGSCDTACHKGLTKKEKSSVDIKVSTEEINKFLISIKTIEIESLVKAGILIVR